MAHSPDRLSNTLALVRIITGVLFIILGLYKVSSLEFARVGFPQFAWEATHGTAVGFYADFLSSFVWQRLGTYAILVGFTELFIGVGLTLGLAVRPISFFGTCCAIASASRNRPDTPFAGAGISPLRIPGERPSTFLFTPPRA